MSWPEPPTHFDYDGLDDTPSDDTDEDIYRERQWEQRHDK